MALFTQVSQQYKFLGATVRGFQLIGGNGGQPISLIANLVEDPDAGDSIAIPAIWTPVTFTLEGFRFRGLLVNQTRQGDLQGNPVYQVRISDPRELLDGVQVVLDRYAGATSGVPNVLNAYGWHEFKYGFGGALTNESGMYWDTNEGDLGLVPGDGITVGVGDAVGIRPAVEYLTTHAGDFGGPIAFGGHSYSVDLSGLPAAPDAFRMGGGICRSLLDLVEELCQYAGADYQVELGDDDVIRFRHVSRATVPTIGTIADWIASVEGDSCQSSTYGTELANEYTNAVLFGGAVQTLHQVENPSGSDAIWPFWGVDIDGNAIWGSGVPESEPHTFVLPCPDVADVVGDLIYPCSIAELRAAAVDVDSWSAYLLSQEPDKAEMLNLVGQVDASNLEDLFGDVVLRRDLIATDPDTAGAFGSMNSDDYWTNRIQRLYDFVSQYSREYLGQQFLVRLPIWIYWKAIPETTEYVSNEEVSDGGYLNEDGLPLGLPYSEIDRFLIDDGRFGCFVAFPLDESMDLASLDPSAATVANGMVYVRATASREIYYPNGTLPYVSVKLDQPIFATPKDPLGGVEDVAAMLNMSPEQVLNASGLRHGSFPVRIYPAAFRPAAAAVPTRSNRYSYGPWTAGSGTPGKTFFDQDDDLTPWNYGSYLGMNAAASARVQTVPTERQVVETATVKLIDVPSVQIGEALIEGGPNVTGISVDLSTSEISTTYTCQSYTPTLGPFGRQNADRIRRFGVASQQLRQKIRTLYQRGRTLERAEVRARVGMLLNASHAVVQRSPHECVMATVVKDPDADTYRTQVSLMAVDETMANVRADDPEIYNRTAGMGLEGLFRPFSTLTDPAEEGDLDDDGFQLPMTVLPHFEDPVEQVPASKMPITRDLNPLKSPNVDILTTGSEFNSGFHRKKGEPDYDNARGVGLAGPVTISGWGVTVTGKPVPNEHDESDPVQEWSDDWIDDHEARTDKHKSGVIGLAWCPYTKTWRPPTVLFGKAKAAITANGEGQMIIDLGDQEYGDDEVKVYERFGGEISVNAYLCATYNPVSGRYIITAATCPTT